MMTNITDFHEIKNGHDRMAAICERIKTCPEFRKQVEENCNPSEEQKRRRHRLYMKRRRDKDPCFRLLTNMRGRLCAAVKSSKGNREYKTRETFGCSIEELRNHLESKFTEGMSWKNYGEWHVDHIKPCRLFNLSIKAEAMECFHYTNLQPLWAMDNFVKSGKYDLAKV